MKWKDEYGREVTLRDVWADIRGINWRGAGLGAWYTIRGMIKMCLYVLAAAAVCFVFGWVSETLAEISMLLAIAWWLMPIILVGAIIGAHDYK